MERKGYHDFFQEYAVTQMGMQQLFEVERKNYYLLFKRIIDIILSLIGLVITSPIVLLFALIIKLESPGPAFFLQERVGFKGDYFKVIKLRSMGVNAEKNGAQWAKKNDPRITRVGSFIRKTRIDEIPQFLNVLIGDMSLVGPRPERPIFTAQFNEEIPGFVERLRVKPGLTGWAQINGGYEITPKEKLKLDLYYIQNVTLILDLKIMFKTIWVVFTGSGAR